ncbi:MAG TPA: hypothetical protein DCW83_05800 [Saprospirales bacterium]|nr:hypothetical protein [Saprospirales bacterium]
MSKAFLDKYLVQILEELKKPSNAKNGQAGFRELVSDRKVHKVSMSVAGVRNQVIAQLVEENIPQEIIASEEMKAVLDKWIPNLIHKIYENATTKYASSPNVKVKGNKSAFSIVTTLVVGGYDHDTKSYGPLSVFKSIGTLFSSQKKTLVKSINGVLRDAGSNKRANNKKFLDLGHRDQSEVTQQQVQRAKSTYFSALETAEPGVEISAEDLKAIDLELFISKKGSIEKDVIEVGFQSATINRADKKSPKARQELIDQLTKAVATLNQTNDLRLSESSDSRVTVEKKKILNRAKKNLKASKNLKVNIKDTKIKLSKAKGKKTVKGKVTRGSAKKVPISIDGVKKMRGKTSANSTIGLAALINAKLSKTVQENMRYPALVNRTGRFAQSVRVVDAITTTQGFPSIGYTYQKNPYQIFEDGAGKAPWANGQRDPRKLIDLSVREIAAGLLHGRFYTRRV